MKLLSRGTEATVPLEEEPTSCLGILTEGCLVSPTLFNVHIDFFVKDLLNSLIEYQLQMKYRMPDSGKVKKKDDRGAKIESIEF